MKHIEIAIYVLKVEINKLNSDLKYGHHLPVHEQEIIEKLQGLNRAVEDIHKKFIATPRNKFANMTEEIWKETNEQTKLNRG